MTKIRKLKRSKTYRYNVNRKRMNKKRLPVLESASVKNAWNPHISSQKNFKKLGLVFDVNNDIKRMNRLGDNCEESLQKKDAETLSIIKNLENDAEKPSKGKNFRFSQDQVNYITYLLKKYGDDYKAMSKDKRNYLQQTWKQIRHKINLFKSIPEHYNEFLNTDKKKCPQMDLKEKEHQTFCVIYILICLSPPILIFK